MRLLLTKSAAAGPGQRGGRQTAARGPPAKAVPHPKGRNGVEEPGEARLAGRPGGSMAVRRPRRCPRRRPTGAPPRECAAPSAKIFDDRSAWPSRARTPDRERADTFQHRPEGLNIAPLAKPPARRRACARGGLARAPRRPGQRASAVHPAARQRPPGQAGAKSAARPTVQTRDLWRRLSPPVCARSGPRSFRGVLFAPAASARRRDPGAAPRQRRDTRQFASRASVAERLSDRDGAEGADELHPHPTGFK